MIRLEVFKTHMRKIIKLNGLAYDDEQLREIYKEIKDKYEEEDFIKAINDKRLRKLWKIKVHFGELEEILDEIAANRVEREAREIKKRQEEELRKAIDEAYPDMEFVKECLKKIKAL